MSCVTHSVKNDRELENIIGGNSLHCIKYLLLITYFQIIKFIWIILKKKKKNRLFGLRTNFKNLILK